MPRHDGFDIHLENTIGDFDPVPDMALESQWRDIIKCQVSSKQQFVFGHIHKGITKGVSWSKVAQFDITAGLMEDHLIFKCHSWDLGLELGKLFGKTGDTLLVGLDGYSRTDHLIPTVCMANDFGIAKQKVATTMVNMMMGIHQAGNWLFGDLFNRLQKAFGHRWHHECIDGHIAVFVEQQSGIAHPQLMIGSDSLALAAGRGGKPHPRTYGTFPRVLGKYVRDEGIITLEDGVRKMTSMAADKLGLIDRGVLAEDKAADITIFDAATVSDKATFEAPHQYPTGIAYVIVNGRIVVEQGEQRPIFPGHVLQK